MDPIEISAALFIAKEIVQLIQANQPLTVEQIAAIILVNAAKIEATKIIIQDEMTKYAGKSVGGA